MGNCLNEEKKCVVDKVKTLLGGDAIGVEIPEESWCNLIQIAVEEYVQQMEMWLIQSQWSSLVNQNLSTKDICFALTNRSIDSDLQFANAFSKQVGLQSQGNFVLKKDSFELIEGQQVYEVPAGREINEVLWETPSEIDHAIFASMGYGAYGYGANIGGGAGSTAFGNTGILNSSSPYSLNGMYYIAPAYDIMLRAADFGMKNRMLRSDLTYKITAGDNGTKLIHLFSIPNYGNQIGARNRQYKCRVWYFYYDTTNMDAAQKNKCLQQCTDIIRYPSQVPLGDTDFCDLNNSSKIWVRKYLTALAKQTLGRIRGKFSGKVAVPGEEVTMDYSSLLSEAESDMEKLKQELKDWLESMKPQTLLSTQAEMAKNLNTVLGYIPKGIYVI